MMKNRGWKLNDFYQIICWWNLSLKSLCGGILKHRITLNLIQNTNAYEIEQTANIQNDCIINLLDVYEYKNMNASILLHSIVLCACNTNWVTLAWVYCMYVATIGQESDKSKIIDGWVLMKFGVKSV